MEFLYDAAVLVFYVCQVTINRGWTLRDQSTVVQWRKLCSSRDYRSTTSDLGLWVDALLFEVIEDIHLPGRILLDLTPDPTSSSQKSQLYP